jgi:cobalt-zinc-cadmium efflux system membrane fusion protein
MKNIPIVIILSLLIYSCNTEPESNSSELKNHHKNIITLTDEQYQIAGIDTGFLIQKKISYIIKLNGKIEVPPQNLVSISVPLGGYLKSTKLLNGMHIKKGEVIAVIEDVQYIQLQQDYLNAKTQLMMLEKEYHRQQELNQSKATSDKVFEQSKVNYQTQLILLKSLEEKLKLIGLNPENLTVENISHSINVYSPISGFVSAVNVNIGKYVNPSDVLFELVNPEDIHLSLTAFENDINHLFIGQKLIAYTNTQPQKKYPCEIILISKNLEKNNSAQVHCHFEKYDKNLLPGMFMNAEIEISNLNANVLPEDAIVRFENQEYAFVVKGKNQFEMIPVQTGITEKGFTQIIGNQLNKEKFVLKGAYNLLLSITKNNEN